ncbi:phage replication protein [Pseudomonas urethralis]|uniref:phage replication protein n=1 Tax=Pseudomonas urethralis TaxID=2740517 RepID=UPI001F33F96D|nr:phage replication protein [Pseudomonas urethralis]
MSIIRAPRPETKFYTLDKAISEDERLSWAARGLLIFLLGKPDNWEVSVTHLIKQTSKAIGKSSGRDAVRVIIKELEAAGYMAVDRARNDGGSFNGMAYTVCERPQTENPSMGSPQTENPAPEKPAPAKPAPGNPPLIKNDLQQPTEEEASTDLEHCAPPAEAGESAGKVIALVPQPRCVIPADMPGPKDPECKTFKAWANYAMAYRKRYHAWPVWNAKAGGQVGQLISRLGIDVAHHVAAYFLTINDARLINGCHNLGDLLAKAEAYHTQWVTNRQMNATTARQQEQTQANMNAAQEAADAIRNGQGGKRNAFL